ncbi:MAG: NusG domain II-containing protein [Spirochaetales bacterium]|nr:NusG domain II-containing protein [Spirochaetales bacterium]
MARKKLGDYSFFFLPMDWFAFFLSVGVFVFVTLGAYGAAGNPGQVSIQAEAGDFLYSLDTQGTYSFEGPIGDTVIEILENRVRVLSSPCRDQICVAAGWLEQTGEWSACLPNRVFVRVRAAAEGEDSVDAQVY